MILDYYLCQLLIRFVLSMKPTLLVLAAGMGSRYGGLKQMDRLGPNGESIIDYSVFDAVREDSEKLFLY